MFAQIGLIFKKLIEKFKAKISTIQCFRGSKDKCVTPTQQPSTTKPAVKLTDICCNILLYIHIIFLTVLTVLFTQWIYLPIYILYFLTWLINIVGISKMGFKNKWSSIFVGSNIIMLTVITFALIVIAIIMPESLIARNIEKKASQIIYGIFAFLNVCLILINIRIFLRIKCNEKLSKMDTKIDETYETIKSRSFDLLIWLRIKKRIDLSNPNNQQQIIDTCETKEIIIRQKYHRNLDPF